MDKVNVVTLVLCIIFFLPVLVGLIKSYSREKIEYSISSFFESIEFLLSLLAAIYITKRIFFENEETIFRRVYEGIPEEIRAALNGQDVLTYLIMVPFITLILLMVLKPITYLLYRFIVTPLSTGIYKVMNSLDRISRRVIIILCQVPRAIFVLLVFGLLLNFSTYYFYSPILSKWMNESKPYQFIYKNALYPVLNSNLAKKVPVIVNDSFKKTVGKVIPKEFDSSGLADKGQSGNQNSKGNIRVIEYFNGVTLDEAVKSSNEIDNKTKEIIGNERDDKIKARLLYRWISRNIKYDLDKAQKLSLDPRGIPSGSIIAYNTKKGVCFDYSCLFISMCRAAGLKVRLITGLGYSGVSWGDHAWNQVYYPLQKKWINVDTTFGTVNNYFDKPDFDVDHKDNEVQGEW